MIFSALPGVQADGDSSGVSLQGALPYQVDVTVDGVTVKSSTGGTYMSDSFPSTESIAEIRADGVLANAEFGDPGQIVVTTKGGSNTLHGSGFWYYQDNKWNAPNPSGPIEVTVTLQLTYGFPRSLEMSVHKKKTGTAKTAKEQLFLALAASNL